MISLVITACTLYRTDDCRRYELTFVDVPLYQCMMGAQPVIAEWARSHPNVYVKKWRCELVNRDMADI